MFTAHNVLLWLSALGAVNGAAGDEGASTVVLRVSSEGVVAMSDDVTPMQTHSRNEGEGMLEWLGRLDDWKAEGEHPAEGDGDKKSLLLWCGGAEGSYELAFVNPRYERFEHELVMEESGAARIALPSAFLTTAYTCRVGAQDDVFHKVRAGLRRGKSLSTAGAVPRTERRVGPASEVHNIVILAGGYTSAERSLWEADLAQLLAAFTNPPGTGYEATNPMLRYQPVVNVFSVWQPSPESGASRNGVTVNNNLGCEYSTSMSRLLRCDASLMLDLAETTDAKPKSENLRNVVALVVVNSAVYGGSGCGGCSGFKTAVFYGRGRDPTSFAAIMYHEMGHSWMHLADEYSYGIAGPQTGSSSNCMSPSLVSNPPWAHLIKAGRLPATPTQGCSYNNWYRASPSCLMLTLGDQRLCPVCQEAGTLYLYDTPTFSITFPTCPLPDETVLVEASGEVRLHTNRNFVARGGVRLRWDLLQVGSTAVRQTLCQGAGGCTDVVVRGSSLTLGQVNTVRLTVYDESPLVVQRSSKMTQTMDFKLLAVAQINKQASGVRERRCYCANERQFDCRGGDSFFSNGGASDVPYYSQCTRGTCEAHTTAYERDGPAATPRTPAPRTPTPRTPVPPTPVPRTPVPPTPVPRTPAPPTPVPRTPVPRTPAPPTPAPRTAVPTTAAPRTPTPTAGGSGLYNLCQGKGVQVVTGSSGVISHPSGGGAYGNNELVCWEVQCAGSVSLQWRKFNTEPRYDKVYLGGAGGAKLWELSGSQLPGPGSYEGGVAVSFVSDVSVTAAGFEVAWECAAPAPPTPAPRTPAPPTPAPSAASPAVPPTFCRSMTTVAGASGAVTHPAQGTYGNHEGLCWRIPCSGLVSISFTRFRTEANYDYVTVNRYVETTGATTVLKVAHGTALPSPVTLQGSALVYFSSDMSITDTGFSLTYTCR